MVAALKDEQGTSPLLLCEPAYPEETDYRAYGWLRRVIVTRYGTTHITWERNHAWDAIAGQYQRMLVRYAVGGEDRRSLAHEHGVSERALSAVASGNTFSHYTRPIRDALTHLGISSNLRMYPKRSRQLAAARQPVLIEAANLIEAARLPNSESVVFSLRLLSGGWS